MLHLERGPAVLIASLRAKSGGAISRGSRDKRDELEVTKGKGRESPGIVTSSHRSHGWTETPSIVVLGFQGNVYA